MKNYKLLKMFFDGNQSSAAFKFLKNDIFIYLN